MEKEKECKAGVGDEEEERIRPYQPFRTLLSLSSLPSPWLFVISLSSSFSFESVPFLSSSPFPLFSPLSQFLLSSLLFLLPASPLLFFPSSPRLFLLSSPLFFSLNCSSLLPSSFLPLLQSFYLPFFTCPYTPSIQLPHFSPPPPPPFPFLPYLFGNNIILYKFPHNYEVSTSMVDS